MSDNGKAMIKEINMDINIGSKREKKTRELKFPTGHIIYRDAAIDLNSILCLIIQYNGGMRN